MEIQSEKKAKKLNSSSMSISSVDSREETNFKRSIDCQDIDSLDHYDYAMDKCEETKRDQLDDFKQRPFSKFLVNSSFLI